MELESILLPGVEAKRPIVIAGPCSAETEEQVMDTAKQLAAKGQKIYRAGIWKPRTKPGGFEGIGVEVLSTEVSAVMTKRSIEIFPNGIFLSNYAAVSLIFRFSVIRAISVENVSWLHRFANRLWT